MPKAIVNRRVNDEPQARQSSMDTLLGTLCIVAILVMAVGVGMALIPGSSNPNLQSASRIAADVARQARGQYLSVLGAIIAMGTGIILTLRSKA